MKDTINLSLTTEEFYALYDFLSVDFIECIKRDEDIDNIDYIYSIASIYRKCDQIVNDLKEDY